MTDEETAKTLEREYYAQLAANNAAEDRGQPKPNKLGTLRGFLHKRGFSYKWLDEHNYTKDED